MSLLVGIVFTIGSGFTGTQREQMKKFLPHNTIVTFKFQEYTKNNVPRFASFLRIRPDVTWEDIVATKQDGESMVVDNDEGDTSNNNNNNSTKKPKKTKGGDTGEGSGDAPGTASLPPCKFGAKCYRQNAQHLKEYSHPTSQKAASSTTGGGGSDTDPMADEDTVPTKQNKTIQSNKVNTKDEDGGSDTDPMGQDDVSNNKNKMNTNNTKNNNDGSETDSMSESEIAKEKLKKPPTLPIHTSLDTTANNMKDEEKEGQTIAACVYGDSCTRKNPDHFKNFSHKKPATPVLPSPGSDTDSMSDSDTKKTSHTAAAPASSSLVDDRPVCPYDENCTRKNPQHFKDVQHPKLDNKKRKDGGSSDTSNKKVKV